MSELETTRDATAAIPRCDDPNHCITCSDEGIPMRVVSLIGDATLAWCENDRGERSEVLTGLIDDLRIGDVLLVHAGTALTRVRTEETR